VKVFIDHTVHCDKHITFPDIEMRPARVDRKVNLHVQLTQLMLSDNVLSVIMQSSSYKYPAEAYLVFCIY